MSQPNATDDEDPYPPLEDPEYVRRVGLRDRLRELLLTSGVRESNTGRATGFRLPEDWELTQRGGLYVVAEPAFWLADDLKVVSQRRLLDQAYQALLAAAAPGLSADGTRPIYDVFTPIIRFSSLTPPSDVEGRVQRVLDAIAWEESYGDSWHADYRGWDCWLVRQATWPHGAIQIFVCAPGEEGHRLLHSSALTLGTAQRLLAEEIVARDADTEPK